MFNKPQIDEVINNKYPRFKEYITFDDSEFPVIMCDLTCIYKELKKVFGKQVICCSALKEVERLKYHVEALKEKIEHPELYKKDDVLWSTRNILDMLPDIYEAIYFEEVKEWAQE